MRLVRCLFFAEVKLIRYPYDFSPLKKILKADLPIIVVQRSSQYPKLGHYRLVVGIDQENVYINDPENKKGGTKISKKGFFKDWEASGKEVTGGVLFVIFNNKHTSKLKKLHIEDVQTNHPHLKRLYN